MWIFLWLILFWNVFFNWQFFGKFQNFWQKRECSLFWFPKFHWYEKAYFAYLLKPGAGYHLVNLHKCFKRRFFFFVVIRCHVLYVNWHNLIDNVVQVLLILFTSSITYWEKSKVLKSKTVVRASLFLLSSLPVLDL